MSRVGKSPIVLPGGVNVTIEPNLVTVEGAKGKLSQPTLPGVEVSQSENVITVTRSSDEPEIRARHGLTRALINNMVTGVSQGFSKKLVVSGVGFRVALAGNDLRMSLGFSHEVIYHLPASVSASVEQNTITISGIDKQQVGQAAADIRALKKPEPYKGKGIAYEGERILRKSGKSGKEK